MNTNGEDFEARFYRRVERLLGERYPALEMEFPRRMRGMGGVTPNFIIKNPQNGASLAGDLKAGPEAPYLPVAMLPRLRLLLEKFREGQIVPGDLIVITTGRLPMVVRKGLLRDGIEFHEEIADVEEAVRYLDAKIATL